MATRNVSMTITYLAWDTSADGGKTGDVGNHTLRWVKDGTSSAPTNSASEVDATNAPGIYKITLTATETNANIGVLCGKSSTANIVVMPITIQFERLPDAAPDAAGGLVISDAGGLDADAMRSNVGDILTDTAVIGSAGAGLTAVPWNAAWDAEVQSEVADGLAAYDPPTKAELDSAFTEIKGGSWASTDTLEAIRDRGDAAWTTGGGGSAPTAAAIADAVWDEATSGHTTSGTFGEQVKTDIDAILVDTGTTLDGKIDTIDGIVDSILVDTGTTLNDKIDVIDGIVDSILVDTAVIGSAGAGLSGVPWNASWDAEVQSEVADALAAYDPPTKAEMDAMWTTAATESYASDGAAATPAQLLYMILCAVSEFSISSTTITGKKVDGSTTAMTWTLDDASSPTSRTRAS